MRAIVNDVARRRNVDMRRVYATGTRKIPWAGAVLSHLTVCMLGAHVRMQANPTVATCRTVSVYVAPRPLR